MSIKTTTNTKAFDKALQIITDDRGKDYGHPKDDFAKAQMIKAAVASCPHTEVRHALEMIGVKMARLTTSPTHLDSVIDIAGYARTIAMILDKEQEDDLHRNTGNASSELGADIDPSSDLVDETSGVPGPGPFPTRMRGKKTSDT